MRKYVLPVIALALLWTACASAQPPRFRGRDQRDDRRGERIARVIRDCEDRTDDFKRAVEHLWRSERRPGNDDLDRGASRLERELNRVRDAWNRDRDYRRTRNSVGGAIDAGRDVNRILQRHRFGSRLRREFEAIKIELNNLADVFEQPRIRW
jgi:hypothetical protein